jgi:hypothetical protein
VEALDVFLDRPWPPAVWQSLSLASSRLTKLNLTIHRGIAEIPAGNFPPLIGGSFNLYLSEDIELPSGREMLSKIERATGLAKWSLLSSIRSVKNFTALMNYPNAVSKLESAVTEPKNLLEFPCSMLGRLRLDHLTVRGWPRDEDAWSAIAIIRPKNLCLMLFSTAILLMENAELIFSSIDELEIDAPDLDARTNYEPFGDCWRCRKLSRSSYLRVGLLSRPNYGLIWLPMQ